MPGRVLSFLMNIAHGGEAADLRSVLGSGCVMLGLVALGLGGLVLAEPGPASRTQGPLRANGFDLSNAVVPRSAILSGGPPRDGIPSIDQPTFVSPARASFLRADDLVVSVNLGGAVRAYPLRILGQYEIVNDQIGEQAFAVTYCPLCGTAMVFDRNVQGRVLSFGVSGLLYQSDVLMYDRQTESLWSQLAMKCVAGGQVGTELRWLVSEQLSFAAWRAKYPDGSVLAPPTGTAKNYGASPYARYENSPDTMFPVPMHRSDLPAKSWGIGTRVNGTAMGYPVALLGQYPTIQDEIHGVAIEVEYDAGKRQATVTETASGRKVPSVSVYWFAWQAFYPDTELWTP